MEGGLGGGTGKRGYKGCLWSHVGSILADVASCSGGLPLGWCAKGRGRRGVCCLGQIEAAYLACRYTLNF